MSDIDLAAIQAAPPEDPDLDEQTDIAAPVDDAPGGDDQDQEV